MDMVYPVLCARNILQHCYHDSGISTSVIQGTQNIRVHYKQISGEHTSLLHLDVCEKINIEQNLLVYCNYNQHVLCKQIIKGNKYMAKCHLLS